MFYSNKKMKKGLLLLYGEPFRFGDQNNRIIGSPQSFIEQIKASISHLKLIKYLKDNNVLLILA